MHSHTHTHSKFSLFTLIMASNEDDSGSFGCSSDLTTKNDVFRNPLINVSFQTLTKCLTNEERYNLSELPVKYYSGPTIDESLNLKPSEK